MRHLRRLWMLLILCLLLQAPAGAIDSISASQSGLQGKTFLVLGDSYTAGYGLTTPEQDWTYVISKGRNMVQLNYSISGSTVAAGVHALFPMAERVLTLPEANPDFVLVQGGTNDYAKGIPLGSVGSDSTETFCGALAFILDTLAERYPAAQIIGFTPWISDDTTNSLDLTQQDYTDAMLEVFSQRGLLCYDASNVRENGIHMEQQSFRATYALRDTDWFHLNAAGHTLFAPIFASWLEAALYGTSYADQFYDLAAADETLRDAVTDFAGVMIGRELHLFAPTKGVTRAELVQVLHRMSGQPSGSTRQISDLEYGTEAYTAFTWAMDQGLISESTAACPSQLVTREMLSAVLNRYYTGLWGGEINALMGLGAYADGKDVSDYAATSFSWALSAGLLSARDGLLRPQGIVSRGDLVCILSQFRQMRP